METFRPSSAALVSGPTLPRMPEPRTGIMAAQTARNPGNSVQSRLGRNDQIGKTAAVVGSQDKADADQFGDGGPVPLDALRIPEEVARESAMMSPSIPI